MASKLCLVTDWEARASRAGFNVSVLSLQLGISRRHLLNFIRSSYGVPPHQWMVQMRMKRASALLREGYYVKEVSHELGFKQVGHFCREFKRYYGVPPGHFMLVPGLEVCTRDSSSHLDKKSPTR